jgi:hypothetical protein
MVTDLQAVVLHVPSARTKYVVVALGVALIEAPVPIEVPPQALVNHFQTAFVPRFPPCTVKVTAVLPLV